MHAILYKFCMSPDAWTGQGEPVSEQVCAMMKKRTEKAAKKSLDDLEKQVASFDFSQDPSALIE